MRQDFTAEKRAAVEKVLAVMKEYIDQHACYDVVFSEKIGYIFLDIPLQGDVKAFDSTLIDTPENILYVLYVNMAYEFMEREGHCVSYTNATPQEKEAFRQWVKRYSDQIPEYNYVLEEVLAKEPDGVDLMLEAGPK